MSDIDEEIKKEQDEAIRKLSEPVPVVPEAKEPPKVETPVLDKEDKEPDDDWLAPEDKTEPIVKDEPVETGKATDEPEDVTTTKPVETKTETPAWSIKKEDYDKMEVELAYYRNREAAMNSDPSYLAKIAPDAFAPRKSAREQLEEKYGKDFLENEFNEREAHIPGTKSFEYGEDARTLVAQERMNNPANIAVAALNHRKKLYDDGMEYMKQVFLDVKKEVPYITENDFAAKVNALADVSGNPIKAVALAVKEMIRRENDVKIKETRLNNEKTVLKEKRAEILPTPPGAQGSSGKTKTKAPVGDFDDLETTY